MIVLKAGKRLRFVTLMAAVVLCILLSACGSDKKAASSEESNGTPDISSESAGDNSQDHLADPMERLSGRFYIDGDSSAASVVIESDGSFTAYYASGTVEQEGYVKYEADANNPKFYVYVFYTDEGKPYMGFVDSGENKISAFETGNGSYRYARVD